MSEVIKLAPPQPTVSHVSDQDPRVVRTDTIHVVFTRADETLAAVRVASALGSAMGAPVRVVQFRPVPYPLPLDAPVSVAPAETDQFIEQVRSAGIDVRVRVFLCRNPDLAIPTAFKHHSLVVMADGAAAGQGHRNGSAAGSKRPAIWSYSSIATNTRRDRVLDLMYLAIGAIGFLLLLAIAKACDRV